jgi:hypothetical protein
MLQFDEYERFDEKIGNILTDHNPSYLATMLIRLPSAVI